MKPPRRETEHEVPPDLRTARDRSDCHSRHIVPTSRRLGLLVETETVET